MDKRRTLTLLSLCLLLVAMCAVAEVAEDHQDPIVTTLPADEGASVDPAFRTGPVTLPADADTESLASTTAQLLYGDGTKLNLTVSVARGAGDTLGELRRLEISAAGQDTAVDAVRYSYEASGDGRRATLAFEADSAIGGQFHGFSDTLTLTLGAGGMLNMQSAVGTPAG